MTDNIRENTYISNNTEQTPRIPPSIHHNDLLRGASYAHYTPIPTLTTAVATSSNPRKAEDPSAAGTECVLGIDEAGRGPVLGPMIYGAFYLPIPLHHSLLADMHHFDDSKVLTPGVRANLMSKLCTEGTDLHGSCGWAIKSLSARDIGAAMLRSGGAYNLNAQAVNATVEIIKGVMGSGVNVREIYVDTIGRPEKYQRDLQRVFPSVRVRVEKKADSLFPCVSAASVVAKVTRDVSCELLYGEFARHQSGMEVAAKGDGAAWGSGYPSDARCVSWLKSEMNPVFGWGNECRFSWGTVKDILEVKESGCVKVEWPTEPDEENMRVSDYFMAEGFGGRSRSQEDELRTWFGSSVEQDVF